MTSPQTTLTTYNNNTPLPNYNDNSHKYHYTNLSQHHNTSTNIQHTIPPTFQFLNPHRPFLPQHYPLFTTHNITRELTYQPFLNPYPTFNKQHLNHIQLTSP
ncbi:two-component system activity regulator YycH, partial [Staphylococcus warneri]|uniref:two-component system activity regulator YycH n=1 Tax=Staphylococcus warneri TaxID=1292 RepID=UPI0034D98312